MAAREKVLLTGGGGFLGNYVIEAAKRDYELHVIEHSTQLSSKEDLIIHSCDLTNDPELVDLLDRVKPEFIIHLAAISDANFCEQHPQESKKLNVKATETLAGWSAGNNAWLLFASSDLVFDGENSPYVEEDEPAPLSEYGRQKVEAEELIKNLDGKFLIGRLPLMYGEKGRNTLTAMVNALKSGKNLNLFTDEFRTPAYAKDVAEMIWKLLEMRFTNTIHLGGSQSISRYKMGKIAAEVIGAKKSQLIAKKQGEMKLPAPRPRNVSLNSEKAFSLGYMPMAFENVMAQLKEYL